MQPSSERQTQDRLGFAMLSILRLICYAWKAPVVDASVHRNMGVATSMQVGRQAGRQPARQAGKQEGVLETARKGIGLDDVPHSPV